MIILAESSIFEVAFFVIAMIVAFIHWLVKESGMFKKGTGVGKDDRRQLVEQMEERQRRRLAQQQGAPARGAQSPRQVAQRRTMPSPEQQNADWRALREALGLPADAAPPNQSQVAPAATSPPFTPQPVRRAQQQQPAPAATFYGEPDLDDEIVAERKAQAAARAAGAYADSLGSPLTEAEVQIIRKLREGVALADLGTRSVSEAAAELQADTAYDFPTESASQIRKKKRGSGATSSATAPTKSAATTGVRRLLVSRNGIRQAILAREILGIPKAWQDDSGPNTSMH